MLADPALCPDSNLLQEYTKNRDPEAFAELTRRHAGLVYGTCHRILLSDDDAQDVSQECFLELARKADSVHTSLPAWLHKLARSRSIDAIRKAAARRRAEQEAARQIGEDSAPTWADLAPYVDAALERLPERLRVPIILHYLEGHKQDRVATEMGVDQSTVSRRLDAGISALREELKKAGALASVAALAVLLTDNASTAAPSVLMATLGKIAISGIGGSSVAATYQIGGLIVKKVWLHAAVAAIVFVSAAALTVPRILAEDAAGPAATSAVPRAGSSKGVNVQVKAEFLEVSEKLAGDMQTRWHFKAAGADAYATMVLDAAGTKAMREMLASGAKIKNSPIISTVSGQRAEVSIVTMIPYTVTKRDPEGRVVSNDQRAFEVRSGFSVVPVVNADGSITMDIHLILTPASGTTAANAAGPSFRGKVPPGGAMALTPVGNGSGNRVFVVITPTVVEKPAKQGARVISDSK